MFSLNKFSYITALISALVFLPACSDDIEPDDDPDNVIDNEIAEQFFSGGELGTSFISTSAAYEQPSPAITNGNMFLSFNRGEKLFEKPFTSNLNGGEREGLGPLYVRTSCLHCHPGYGHGKSQENGHFNTSEVGNGYLLVVFNPATDAYVPWLAGMPQTHAVAPFKDPIDETKITIEWKDYTDEWNNTFPDGEKYSLRYPEVSIPQNAIYVINQGYSDATTGDYAVRLESTIGIYGSGLIDAISEDDLIAQYKKEEADGFMQNGLNTALFSNGSYKSFYSNSRQGDGTPYVRRFTYALSRGPLLDGAGANAIWNITNVTRSDRTYHYLDLNGKIYATYASRDPEVQAAFPEFIAKQPGVEKHPEWTSDNMEQNIFNYLTSTSLEPEMSDDDYIAFMVWHRGLAVPAARNIDDETIQHGKKVFEEIGCAYCHRPSWTTGSDIVADPNKFIRSDGESLASLMPRYPNQKIWPYSDFIQHKLHMVNDIRTGWCRTTPLWGRGLHQLCTGATYADRLHDCRARNVIESIMWHGNAQSDARRSVEQFRNLSKADRDAIVEFINAI
ncbi:MAG: di-heme oxidoredictase family protein [Muribaculaceae bacterium]